MYSSLERVKASFQINFSFVQLFFIEGHYTIKETILNDETSCHTIHSKFRCTEFL
ncbi:MAG: hypothetical protein ACJA1C_001189 [Crocinitomicaceae bacterium]|jgi:hypothetical protein